MTARMYTLNLFVASEDEELKRRYVEHVYLHNKKLFTDPYPDSGFDLITPDVETCVEVKEHSENGPPLYDAKINFKVKCAMIREFTTPIIGAEKVGFQLLPRSSLATRTPFRLANSVGIIDSGYRGEISAVLDKRYTGNLNNSVDVTYHIVKYERLFQICLGDLTPFRVEIVDSVEELGTTSRGEGGFGSTGH